MISRSVAVGVLAAGCITAAAGASFVAARQTADQPIVEAPAAVASPAVAETEAVVEPAPASAPVVEPSAVPAVKPAPAAAPARRVPASRETTRPARKPAESIADRPAAPAAPIEAPASGPHPQPVPSIPAPVVEPESTAPRVDPAPKPAEPEMLEVTLPSSAVVGLEIETSVTSEQARLEDRVDARVTRDVYADGRLVIPAGSRVIGGVTLVERGGKFKERARLGVRFHTLVLANGRQHSIRTETVYREGDSPGAESSKKIGGAAIGGAVLGAILGGGKGAATGATIGAGAGTAAVMAGGRNAATLPGGSVVTVKLAAPLTIEVDK